MISTLSGSFWPSKIRMASSFDISSRSTELSSATIFRISASIAARSSGVNGRSGREVVVVAVLDRRPDADLDGREEPLDGVGRQVRRGVAVEIERLGRAAPSRSRSCASARTRVARSTSFPSSLPASASFARRGPIAAATSARVVPDGDRFRRSVGQRERHCLCQGFHDSTNPIGVRPEKEKTRDPRVVWTSW